MEQFRDNTDWRVKGLYIYWYINWVFSRGAWKRTYDRPPCSHHRSEQYALHREINLEDEMY